VEQWKNKEIFIKKKQLKKLEACFFDVQCFLETHENDQKI